ncbi:hypothetical protein D9M69_734670 [compost metagenome]
MSWKGVTGATGPKGSSRIRSAASGTSAMTVGAKKWPSRSSGAPPVSTRAPWPCASRTNSFMTATRRACISGPIWTFGSSPLPTLVAATVSLNTSRKRA